MVVCRFLASMLVVAMRQTSGFNVHRIRHNLRPIGSTVSGYIDISEERDGSLLKKVLKEGDLVNGIVMNEDVVSIAWNIFRADGSLAHSSDVLEDRFEFRIGADPREVIMGWEVAVKSGMYLGEVASLIIGPQYGFRENGEPLGIKKNETIVTELKILDFKPSPRRKFRTVGEGSENDSTRDDIMGRIRAGQVKVQPSDHDSQDRNIHAFGEGDGDNYHTQQERTKIPVGDSAAVSPKTSTTIGNSAPKFFDPSKHRVDPNQRISGKGKGYTWEETMQTIDVDIPVGSVLSKRDVSIKISSGYVCVRYAFSTQQEEGRAHSDDRIILEGPLHGKILPDEMMWSISQSSASPTAGSIISLSLSKSIGFQDIWASFLDRDFLRNKEEIEDS